MTPLEIAINLDQATTNAQATIQMAEENKITLNNAYKIQHLGIQIRKDRKEKIVGYKLGFTSKAKMQQMGVHDLIWGVLTNAMEIKLEEILSLSKYIHPRAEPEIAFLVEKDITKAITLKECTKYIKKCAGAIEVIDSRYKNFKFSLEDVVADNCSSSGYMIGDWKELPKNINRLKMQLYFNDKLQEEGSSFEILENPLASVVELSRLATLSNINLKKGDIILAGAATKAIFLKPNTTVTANIEQLGKISFTTTK